MQQSEATILIQKGITNEFPQNWIDLGCGNGTFTLSLANLLPLESHITAFDKTSQQLPYSINGIKIDFRKADFIDEQIAVSPLDGILMANSLHFVADKTKLIKQLENIFKGNPKFLIVEYDTTTASPWVPYPISYQKLNQEFNQLGYRTDKLAEMPSKFGGIIYSALAFK
ncbi:class I SAM-dependent methyltransferase [Mucilaginibacter sp. SMC90]|uniref:class I SAM-dependent methyltransferase n=1 Tax=Mucilaginibacter sp. SMC90 TaxID=2929803 RepID=UPI001FB31D15|nr:class I SAM-dependent methyltransferase [Mucilaginibacter sp. SMC90]UOE46301.1 class I SAM-dependent methyltransferase [Mucilaginibacter sp. SMC90]